LVEARRRLRRAGVNNYQLHNDKIQLKEILRNKCDWILLDVPCSGSGTLRRNPDLKWKFSIEKLDELITVQQKILSEAVEMLKPKGKIVYVTCSLIQEENLSQVVKFCKEYGFKIENEKIFQTVPKSRQMDGFFSVTLTK
jgi:16S rRNA (cytosine967-C5)-methyltransferase